MMVIQCVGMPGWWVKGHPFQGDVTGWYLKSYDPGAESGAGWEWTADKADAQVFDSTKQAFECWTAVNPLMPFRPTDGKPNKPLTAFSITLEPVTTKEETP